MSRIKQENFHTYAGPVEPYQYQQPPNQNVENNPIPPGQNANQPPNPQEGAEVVQQVLPNDVHYFPGITLKFCVSGDMQILEFCRFY